MSSSSRRHTDRRTGAIYDDPTIRPFADFIRDQAQGKTHDELGEALYDLAERVRETGKKGSVTLVITVEPMKGDPDRVLVVSDEIKLRLPEFPRKPSIFYTAEDGNLQRTDPDQLSFDSLREVPAPAATEVREVRA